MASEPLWCVYRFSRLTDDFEIIGIYSQKSDAETFIGSLADNGGMDPVKTPMQRTFEQVRDEMLLTRLAGLGLKLTLAQFLGPEVVEQGGK